MKFDYSDCSGEITTFEGCSCTPRGTLELNQFELGDLITMVGAHNSAV